MNTLTKTITQEFIEDNLKDALEKGYVHDRDSINEFYNEILYDFIAKKGSSLILSENPDFNLSKTLISDELIGMYSVNDLLFDIALEVLK